MAGGGLTVEAVRMRLVAPCGMNCGLCVAYRREKNPCPGCRVDEGTKAKTRFHCRIKTCEKLRRGKARYCFACESFPCDTLIHLDKRYRSKYGMSMLDNLEKIRESGIRQFVKKEKAKWTCPSCGGLLCVHKAQCELCDYRWR